jgi:hypothetical protein
MLDFSVMSREIWLRLQFVVAIGEGNGELKAEAVKVICRITQVTFV